MTLYNDHLDCVSKDKFSANGGLQTCKNKQINLVVLVYYLHSFTIEIEFNCVLTIVGVNALSSHASLLVFRSKDLIAFLLIY